jgi:hypothetical protein
VRFIISVSKVVGLNKFTDDDFNQIQINKLKPLYITFLLEMFWREDLQNNYQFPKKLVECLKINKKLIPFTDVHHMMNCKKFIKDEAFIDITNELQ